MVAVRSSKKNQLWYRPEQFSFGCKALLQFPADLQRFVLDGLFGTSGFQRKIHTGGCNYSSSYIMNGQGDVKFSFLLFHERPIQLFGGPLVFVTLLSNFFFFGSCDGLASLAGLIGGQF